MRPRAALGGLVVLALTLTAATALAAPPEETGWSPLFTEGPAVAVGFVQDHVVVATGDAGTVGLQGSGGACSPTGEPEDADLFLIPFPDGEDCVDTLDTGSALGQEGVVAAATAEHRGRVVVGLPRVLTGSGGSSNLAAYDLADGQLLAKWRVAAQGTVRLVAMDPNGTAVGVATRDGQGPSAAHRLNHFDGGGVRKGSFTLPGAARAIDVSDNGRFLALGGNFTQGNASFGWASLYDLSRPTTQNPVHEQEVLEAVEGVVSSIAVSDGGRVVVGTAGGRVLVFAPSGSGVDLDVGDGPARVALDPTGEVVVAAAGESLVRITGLPERAEAAWDQPLNGSASAVVVRGPYIFAQAGALAAYDHVGQRLWERAPAELLAINATGRGIALASTQAPPGATFKAETSVVGAALVANLTLEQPAEPPVVSPGDIGVVNLTVTNVGSAILNASFVADVPPGLTITAFPDHVVLRPNASVPVQLAVEVGPHAVPGVVNVPLRIDAEPPVNTTVNVTIEVGRATRVTIDLAPDSPAEQAVVQGQQVGVNVVLRNAGNVEAGVSLEVVQFPTEGRAWAIDLEPGIEVPVQPDAVTTATVLLTVPETAENGTRNHLIIRAVAGEGSAAVDVDLTVNPFESLTISPDRITKKVAPGGTVGYLVTLTNVGTVPSNLTVAADPIDENDEPYVPAGWGVVLDDREALLVPDEGTSLRFEVSAPPGATSGDRLKVRVLARTADGVTAEAIAFAVVDESLDPGLEEPRREPLSPLLTVLALLVAAGSTGWWNHRKH